MFQVTKPSWLEGFLARCDWTILTWHINPGYYIESAIDWALYYINSALEWGQTAYDWARVTWDSLWSEASKIWTNINNLWDSLWQQAQNLWGNITQWWNEHFPVFTDWVVTRWGAFTDWVIDVKDVVVETWNQDIYPIIKSIDIPGIFKGLWDDFLGIGWADIWQDIKDFFTDTIPKTAKELWNWFWDWAKELPFISKEDAEVIAEEEGEAGKEAKHWWDIFLEDTKAFFAGPITWLLGKWDWDTFFGWVGPFFEAAGGTEAERDEEYNKVPQVDENIDEKAKMLRDEKLYELDETWSLISPEIDKIRAKIKSEVE